MTTSTVVAFPGRPDPEFDIHDRLRKIRRTVGLTQAEYAGVLKVGPKSMAAYEAGTRTPPDDELERIAAQIHRSFGFRSEWVKNGDGPPTDGGSQLPRVDSNHEPIGNRLSLVRPRTSLSPDRDLVAA